MHRRLDHINVPRAANVRRIVAAVVRAVEAGIVASRIAVVALAVVSNGEAGCAAVKRLDGFHVREARALPSLYLADAVAIAYDIA